MLLGEAGVGKSSAINILLDMDVLPDGGNKHVTNCLIEVRYGEKFACQTVMCKKDEKKRQQHLDAYMCDEEYGNSFTNKPKEVFNSAETLYAHLQKLFVRIGKLSDRQAAKIEKLVLLIPSAFLKNNNVSFIDTPGMKSGDSHVLFDMLIREASEKATTICVFGHQRAEIQSDFAQTVLPLVLSKGQDNPPITLFMTGGKNLHFKNHINSFEEVRNYDFLDNYMGQVMVFLDNCPFNLVVDRDTLTTQLERNFKHLVVPHLQYSSKEQKTLFVKEFVFCLTQEKFNKSTWVDDQAGRLVVRASSNLHEQVKYNSKNKTGRQFSCIDERVW